MKASKCSILDRFIVKIQKGKFQMFFMLNYVNSAPWINKNRLKIVFFIVIFLWPVMNTQLVTMLIPKRSHRELCRSQNVLFWFDPLALQYSMYTVYCIALLVLRHAISIHIFIFFIWETTRSDFVNKLWRICETF